MSLTININSEDVQERLFKHFLDGALEHHEDTMHNSDEISVTPTLLVS